MTPSRDSLKTGVAGGTQGDHLGRKQTHRQMTTQDGPPVLPHSQVGWRRGPTKVKKTRVGWMRVLERHSSYLGDV